MADASVTSIQQDSKQVAAITSINDQSVLAVDETGAIKVTETNAAVAIVDPETGLAVVAGVQRKTACVVTESGAFCYTNKEEIIMSVIEIGSLQKKETAAANGEDCKDERTCREKCCAISTSRINGRKGPSPVVEMKPSTRKAQGQGWNWLKGYFFDLSSNYLREISAYVNLFFSIVLLLFTIISLAIKGSRNNIPDYVNLCLTVISSTLNIIDAIIVSCYYNCKLFRDLCKCLKYWHKRCKSRDKNDNDSESETTVSKCCCDCCSCCDCCCYCVDAIRNHFIKTDIQIEPRPSKCCQDGTNCGRCFNVFGKSKYADMVRLLLIEVFVYPITICSMLRVFLDIHLRSEDGIDFLTGLSIATFVASALWKVFIIYICRSLVIFWTIRTIEKFRNCGPVAETGRVYPYWFFAHVIGQMLAQILMIVCIGAKMFYENRNFPADNAIRISPYLWYMIVGGFFIPLAGIFTFLIYSYYYVQEYPIGFFLDYLHVIFAKKQGFEEDKKQQAEAEENDDPAVYYDSKVAEKVRSDYDKIHAVSFINKYGYVFQSPLLVALSIVYALFLLAFAICCVLEPDPVTGVTNFVVLHGSTTGWVIFFVLGVILVNLLNVFVLLIAGMWMAIIIVVILAIALVIVICIFCFVAGTTTSSSDDHRRRRY